MKNELNNFLQKWLAWIKLERRLSTQTVKAYQTDLNLFLDHLSKHKNKLIDIVDLEKLDQSDLTSWFYNRIKLRC